MVFSFYATRKYNATIVEDEVIHLFYTRGMLDDYVLHARSNGDCSCIFQLDLRISAGDILAGSR